MVSYFEFVVYQSHVSFFFQKLLKKKMQSKFLDCDPSKACKSDVWMLFLIG